ncbi:MAG: GIY-YIG nuclease family protein [Erysipelotrichaceae bacterium]|nr:GIY-YIG nuclease family protein [Erysipelotrichaceae bacterium]
MESIRKLAELFVQGMQNSRSKEDFIFYLENKNCKIKLREHRLSVILPNKYTISFKQDTDASYKFLKKKKDFLKICYENNIIIGKRVIYVLKLSNNNYYVGQTNDFYKRMKKHFNEDKVAANWTTKYPPQRILEVIDMSDLNESSCMLYETSKTLELMMKYGFERVRGGDYCKESIKEIIHTIYAHGYELKKGIPNPKNKKSEKYELAKEELKKRKVLYSHE